MSKPLTEISLLTIKEASEFTRWKVSTLYTKVHRREIASVRIGGSLRFRKSDLLKLIEERPALRPTGGER